MKFINKDLYKTNATDFLFSVSLSKKEMYLLGIHSHLSLEADLYLEHDDSIYILTGMYSGELVHKSIVEKVIPSILKKIKMAQLLK
jgi:hypothetical protein